MKNRNLSILIIFLFLFACKKDTDVFIPYDNPIPDIEYVMGSVGGVVIGEGANPIANASIKLSTKTNTQELMTDENGIFFFRNVEINAERTYLQIETEGYFSSSRNFTPRKEGTEFLKIQLMSATSSGSYIATESGLVDVMGGGTIELPAEAVVDTDGNQYEGTVNISAQYLNGSSPVLGEQMPGSMAALNTEGESKILASYGVFALKLATENGESLKFDSGKTATIRVPVSDSLIMNAPLTIQLWNFDETLGVWLEEGQGQLVGANYEATVSQSGFWNFGVPHNVINLKANISIDENNVPFENVFTKVTVLGSGVCAFAYTDNGGVLDGVVAASQVLRIQIYDNCLNVIHSADVGPFPADSDNLNIPVSLANAFVVQLYGSLTCDGAPVTEGYVKIGNGEEEHFIFADANGNFSSVFNLCGADEFELKGIDIENGEESEANFYLGEETVDAGTLNVCE